MASRPALQEMLKEFLFSLKSDDISGNSDIHQAMKRTGNGE